MDDKTIVETVCHHKRDVHMPTIVKFQNGSLGGRAEYSALEYKKDKRKRALVMAGESIYTGDLVDSQQYDTYICIRNKETNKVHIVPAQQTLLSNNIYRQLEQKQPLTKLSKEQSSKKLLKEFSGRKTMRILENRDQMMVNVEVVRKDLDETVEESTRLDKDDEEDDTLPDPTGNNEEYLASIVPICNKAAKTISDVYDVEDVVPLMLLNRLDAEAKVVHTTPLETLPIESEYLRDCIKRIQEKELPSRQDFLHLKLIIYMDALQSLIALRKRQMKFAELSHITEKIENDVRRRFADPNVAKSCTRTTFSTEKALTHFIVLALLISEKHEVDVNVLARTLRTSKQRIVTYAHIVNARPKSRSDVLSLRLPSTVPKLSVNRRFQRKK